MLILTGYTDRSSEKRVKIDNRCYYGYELNTTWHEAVALCEDLGFELAYPIFEANNPSMLKNKEIFDGYKNVYGKDMTSAWLGLRKDGPSWFQADASVNLHTVLRTYLHENESNTIDGCLYILPGIEKFFIDPCEMEKPVLCYYDCTGWYTVPLNSSL